MVLRPPKNSEYSFPLLAPLCSGNTHSFKNTQ
jgi:hypothetical protein